MIGAVDGQGAVLRYQQPGRGAAETEIGTYLAEDSIEQELSATLQGPAWPQEEEEP